MHGFLSSRAQWRANLDALCRVTRPVTVELFGHARSPSPEDPRCYEPDHYVRAFEAIRESVGAERWFVLGYSLGAGLTLRYAFDHPERVIGHLFTNSTSGLADEAQRASWRAGAAESAARIRAGGRAAMERIPVHPRHARRLPEPIHRALLEDAALHSPEGIASTLEVTNPDASMRARLAENRRPVCLLWGVRERRFAPLAEHAATHLPGLTVERIDAGHGMNMEAPEAFDDAVTRFIAQCLTSSTS